ncbi:MAG: nucleotidyl transferase AbiEii/AbiGii toxin family protein [Deltaproteobacteria bacterium]
MARARKEDFQLLLIRHANERLLYRLARSAHRRHFVLKGATLFSLWLDQPHRATRDVDLLGFGDPTAERIHGIFEEVLGGEVDDDGVRFEVASLKVTPIREGQAYGGVRAVLVARVDAARVRLQFDVGFGDATVPAPLTVTLPTLLGFPAARLRAYRRETVVAEKLHAMVELGLANSRMKDLYDILILSRRFDFEGEELRRAIHATFDRRRTPLPEGLPVGLTPAFTEDGSKSSQWRAFLKKSDAAFVFDLPMVAREVARFVSEPMDAARLAHPLSMRWEPGGPWAEPERPGRDKQLSRSRVGG